MIFHKTKTIWKHENSLTKHILIQALVLIYFSAGGRSELVTDLNLKGKSFMLEVRYQRTSKNGSNIAYEIEEFHSAWQQRSRLHYKQHGHENGLSGAQWKTFLSNERVVLMMDSKQGANCALVFPDFLDQLFELTVLEGFEHSHLIGTARLLSFIEQNFDKFSIETNYREDNKYELRRAAFRRSGSVFKIDLFYPTDRKENLPNGIPHKLTIFNPDLEQRLSYEFLRFQPLKDHFQSSTSNAASLNQYADYNSNSVSFDLFHFDRAIGCSKVLEMGSGGRLNLTGHDSVRFSFNARPTFQDRPLYDLSVVYEANLAVLQLQQFSAGAGANSIIDFKANRNYLTTRRFSAETQQNVRQMLGADKREESLCFMSRVEDDKHDSKEHETSNQLKLSEMLFGTERLVYLGLARVRGIVARVYESHHCDWPIWLQVPSVFEEAETMPNDQKGDGKLVAEVKLRRRDEVKLMKRHDIAMTNVFYFSQTTSSEQDLDGAKLLLVELFWKSNSTGALIRTISIPIYDFSWNLQSSSPLGGRYEDALSLQDNCFASTNLDADFAAINFELKARFDWEKQNWLMDRAARNLALLRMAQSSLHLNPVSMVYDIESRLDLGGKGAESDRSVSLSVSMRAATRTKSPTRLLFICMVHLNLVYFEAYQVLNFQACHRLAAQRRADTIFAFDIRSSKCQIIQPVFLEINQLKTMLQNICVFGQMSGPYEVYTIFHHNALILRVGEPFEGLPAVRNTIHLVKAIQLHNPHSSDDANSTITFDLINGHIRRLNERIGHNKEPERFPVSSKKFPGFGLLESDAQNKLVRPAPSEERDIENQGPSSMSFEHCQTACLRDFDCRTYSFCFNRSELSCIVTSVSFAEPEIVNQLTQLKKVKAKFGQKFQLKIGTGNQTAQVVKHPNCELHNKFYENYFEHDANVLYTLPISKASAIVVATREQCAELCFRSTINYLKELNQFAARDERSNSDTNLGGKKVCTSYYYLDSLRIDAKVLREISAQSSIDGSNQETGVEDFCFLNELVSEEEEAKEVDGKTSSNQKDLEFEKFVFDYTNLYSKQVGISLVESPDSINRSTATDNFGSLKNCFGPQECARLCFNSRAQVGRPRCRSFDFVEVTSQTGLIHKYCAFNSVTFKSSLEDQRYDLIRYGSNRQERMPTDSSELVLVWHYEPRDLIASQSTDGVNLINLGHAPNHQIHLAGFGLFCVAVVFIITGVAIGFALSSRLLSRTNNEDSRELLGI